MATRNDVTGDEVKTKVNSDKYRDNWDAIFGKKEPAKEEKPSTDKN